MNAQRRKRILALDIPRINAELQEIRDEEQEAYDNMTENMQDSERGQKAQECIDAMDSLISALDDFETLDL